MINERYGINFKKRWELFSIIKFEFDKRENITIEDVIPKVTRSDKESNSIPNFELTFKILAKNPSKKSHTIPNKTKTANK